MQRLSGDFNRGYRRAIQDIEDVFDYVQEDLKHHHKALTGIRARELLACILINREKIRDDWGGFIRWNNQLDGFEYFKKGES